MDSNNHLAHEAVELKITTEELRKMKFEAHEILKKCGFRNKAEVFRALASNECHK